MDFITLYLTLFFSPSPDELDTRVVCVEGVCSLLTPSARGWEGQSVGLTPAPAQLDTHSPPVMIMMTHRTCTQTITNERGPGDNRRQCSINNQYYNMASLF